MGKSVRLFFPVSRDFRIDLVVIQHVMKELHQIARRGKRWKKPEVLRIVVVDTDAASAHIRAGMLVAANQAAFVDVCVEAEALQVYLQHALTGVGAWPDRVVGCIGRQAGHALERRLDLFRRMMPGVEWEVLR